MRKQRRALEIYDAVMVYCRPRINIRRWANTMRRGGFAQESAEEFGGNVSREDLAHLELRLFVFMVVVVGVATGIIVAVN